MDFAWAENYPEVYKICTLFNLTELSHPIRYSYKSLSSFLQEGPQCGLVALAIYLGEPTKQSVNEIVERAKAEGFTNNGEMFSAVNMLKLAKIFLKDSNKIELHDGILDCEYIKESLLAGSCLLVPYDSDKNNSPCLENGHKAHWAIISGAAQTDNDFYVFARHGKAKNVAAWKLSQLSLSNSQLNEVGSYPKMPEIVFKLPDGGINGSLGLNRKAIVLTDL